MKKNKTEDSQNSFEKVIPTAWMAAYRRTFSDIPFSKEIFEKLEELRKKKNYKEIPSDFKKPELAPQFEARHKLINKLIYQIDSSQILELASGFSSRGLSMSKEDNFNYVEIDLPSVISEKKEIIKEISKNNNFKIPDNLHFEAGNVLEFRNLENATKYFEKSKPITIINEGLLRYLSFQEKAKVAENIHRLLEKFNGVWITSDVSLRKVFSKENKIMNEYVQKISELTGKDIVSNRFETEEDARKFFENLGFLIERHSFMEVKNDLVSPQKINLQDSQVKEQIEDAVVFVMKPFYETAYKISRT